MKRDLRATLALLGLLSVLCGVVYPLLVSGGAWLLKAWQPDQKAVIWQGRSVGLAAVGQEFSGPGWFWGRPSATAATPYDASASSGSNLGPANPGLRERVAERCAALRALDPDNREPIPVDLVTASGSGLDPHISPEGARWQAARVARARGLPVAVVDSLVAAGTETPVLGLLGRPRVNVLRLNASVHDIAARIPSSQ
ncbi:MAG: potassium-transporting ATPase subunit KdpC [Candidatus Delongbacteria bacterium]